MNKDFKKFSLLDESIKTVASNSTSPLPESVEEAAVCPKDQKICSDEYCMAFNKCEKSQIYIQYISGVELIALKKSRQQAPFKTKRESEAWQDGFIAGYQYHQSHHSAEVERLREVLIKISQAKYGTEYCAAEFGFHRLTNIAKEALKETQS